MTSSLVGKFSTTRPPGKFLVVQMVKNPPASAEDRVDVGSVPGLGRSPEGGNGNPLQYSCLENSMDGPWATVHGLAESDMGLQNLQCCT